MKCMNCSEEVVAGMKSHDGFTFCDGKCKDAYREWHIQWLTKARELAYKAENAPKEEEIKEEPKEDLTEKLRKEGKIKDSEEVAYVTGLGEKGSEREKTVIVTKKTEKTKKATK